MTLFAKQMYVLYESQQQDAKVSCFVNDSSYDPCTSGSYYQLRSRIYAEHALAYAMAANAGVVKAIVSFYRIDSDSAFERFRSRIPINDVNTVHAFKKHLVAFLGLKELARKFGLCDFDIKVFLLENKRICNEVSELKATARKQQSEITAVKEALAQARKQNVETEKELSAERKQLDEQEEELQELYDLQDNLEQYSRKNSLEFHGVPESAFTSTEEAVIKIANALDVPVVAEDRDFSQTKHTGR